MSGQSRSKGLSEPEGMAHIESYLLSALRPSEYYRSHNLSEHVFYNWLRRYRRVHPELCVAKAKSTPVKREFHELRFDNVPMEVPCVSGIEIHYPHGVKVVIGQGGGIDMDKLFSFIKLRL